MNAFARQHVLVAQRLHWWRRRIDGETQPEPKVPKKRRRPTAAVEEARLVPVVLRAPASEHGPAIVVRLGHVALELREPGMVSPDWLAALMRELSRSAP